MLLGILTRVLPFPILGTVPTLQDPAGPYGREAAEELGGAGGIPGSSPAQLWGSGLMS